MAICWAWLFTCVVFYFSAVLGVSVPFPFRAWDRVWNLIISIPGHCLLIYTVQHCDHLAWGREAGRYASRANILYALLSVFLCPKLRKVEVGILLSGCPSVCASVRHTICYEPYMIYEFLMENS